MDRRKFLLGTSATLAATCLGKPALGPNSKGVPEATEELIVRTSLPQGTWKMLSQISQEDIQFLERLSQSITATHWYGSPNA